MHADIKMIHKGFIEFGGWINILAGLLFLSFWLLYVLLLPYNQLTDTLEILVVDSDWFMVNTFGIAGALLGILGLPWLYFAQRDQINGWGTTGFILSLAGSALLLPPLVWDSMLWPVIAEQDPTLLRFDGPIYSSRLFLPYFIGAGVVHCLGFVLFGWGTFRTGILGKYPPLITATGALFFDLGSLAGPVQVYPRTLGLVLFAGGMIWLGALLKRLR